MQLESDFLAHGAVELAQLAGCLPPHAVGHVCFLRAWVVSHATDEAPPDGLVLGDAAGRRIEAAAQWTGERGALLQALLDVGQVEKVDGGFRVLHLEAYVKAWNQNRAAKERMRTARERSANMRVTASERSAKFDGQTQTQTQTQTQKEEPASQGEPPGPPSPEEQADEQPVDVSGDVEPLEAEERPPLELVAQDAGPKQRRKSAAEELYDGLQENRREKCEARGLPFIDERWPAQRKNRDLGPLARLLPGSDARARFVAAWNEFLDDERMGQLNVPWSLGYFLQSLPQWEGKALKAAGGGV